MSTLLDEETVVLEGLDFEIPCARGEHPAEVIVRCRFCQAGSFLCREHLENARRTVEEYLARHAHGVCLCSGCGVSMETFDELIEVVPL